ncbi:MAG TPA: cell envelope integrity protein TolA [Candidatus Krumholzibacteria bacterium]|nr:cell envelope integrity protein TolA [Candidatus Krumholzibacteria bacterium]
MSGVASLLTAMRVPEERDRTLLWAVIISIMIHASLLGFGLYQRQRGLEIDLTRAQEERDLPVEVALVEPPLRPIPTERTSTNLSTVSSEASDLDPRDTQSDVPSGQQLLEQTPPGGSGAEQRAEPGEEASGTEREKELPQEQEGLSEALRQSRQGTTLDAPHDFALPAERPDFGDDGSASMTIGNITLNTTAWDFAPYLLDLKRRIRQKWIPPMAFAQLGAIHGYTWVNFRIYPDGRMTELAVVETEGHDSLHRSSENAIRGAAPFRPLPDHFPEDYLEITFGFYYLLPGDELRYFRDGRPVRKDERARDDEGSP